MPKLDINGYNATFRTFIEFAQKTQKDGYDSACAKATFSNRRITVSALSLNETSALLRKTAEKTSNDSTRAIFKTAIIDMFGGEEKIPASVKKAMIMDDYGDGKPLTARRIMAVKDAIDAEKSMREKGVSQFSDPATRQAALAKGYREEELPKLAKAVNYFMNSKKDTGITEAMALEIVATPGTAANRLMNYGGRFLKSAEDFADGLRLLELFEQWHDDLSSTAAAIASTGNSRAERDFEPEATDTPTKLNADYEFVKPECRHILERFVFEDLACNPKADLKATSGEAIFGVENNNVTRFVCQGCGKSNWSTIAQIPPGSRSLIFKAFNQLCTLAKDANEAKTGIGVRFFDTTNSKILVSRMLKNYDQLAALDAKGRLTAKNIVRICVPEMNLTGRYEPKALHDLLEEIYSEVGEDIENGASLAMMMESAGCTLAEAREALQQGRTLPQVPFYSEAQMELNALGTVKGARNQMEYDMIRPANYAKISAPDQDLINEGDVAGFGVLFPDGEQFTANGTQQGRENINRIAEKIENLCGSVHPRQTSSVMAMLSQAGMGVLVTNLPSHGIVGNEHCVMDFSLSKNNETGDVFIRYSSPKGLKFAFEWTAIVKIDGTVTTSPFQFTDEDTLKAKTDAAFEAFNKKIGKYMGGNNGVADEACAAAARKLVDLAKDDLDLLQLLTENKGEAAKHILADSNNAFRTDEEIARRVKALRANVDELRMATNGDPHALKVAIRQLAHGNGKPLAAGIITKMFKTASELDLKPVTENMGSRSSLKHLEACCQLRAKMYEVINSSGLLDGEEIGADDKLIAESLALSAICPRLGADAVRWLHGGLYSQDAPKIRDAIDRIRFNEARLPGYMNINNKITTFADEFYRAMYNVGAGVMDSMLGIENPADFQNFHGDPTVSSFRPIHDIVKRFALMDKPTGWEEAKMNAREAYRKFKRSAVDGVMAQALSLVADDPDARKLVIGHISLLLMRSNATLRSAEEVRERVRAILANVQELRALAKGDEDVFKAGIELLTKLEGNTLPPGSFVNIFAGVKNLSVNDLKNVRPGCGTLELHKAFRSFMDSAQTVMNGSNAGEILQAPLYRVPLKTFIGHLILAKCGRQNMRTLSETLHGEEGGQLSQLYRGFQKQDTGYQPAGNDVLIPMRMTVLATKCMDELNRFDSLVAEAAGHDMDDYQGLDFDEEFEYDQNLVNDVGRELEAIIQENPQAYEPN